VLTHHQLLLFWLQLLVLLAAARGLGGLMRRIGQPAVVGELAAGLLLGPSALGLLAPDAQRWLFPDDSVQRALQSAVAWIGAFLLLIATGYETDLVLMRRLGRATARVAVGSLLLPVLSGLALGLLMPEAFLGPRAQREVFALFMATALGISALPVIAKVLAELDLMRRNVAQMILAAAMANDLTGWILLGVVSGLAQSGTVELGRLLGTIAGLLLFLGLAFGVGQRAVDAALRGVRQRRSGALGAASVMVLAGLLAGAAAHAIGLEAVFGAFIAGIVLGRSRFQEPEAFHSLHVLTLSFFAPIFFASAGLRVDLTLLAERSVWIWGAIVLGAASASKFLGAWIGARLAGIPRREAFALGAGLNARGAVEIVVATVGLSLGVLNAASYAVVVLLAIATSMMAPPLLRAALRGWRGSREERERLAREHLLGGNVLVRKSRLLLPSHGGPNSVLAARLLDLAWPEGVEATVLSVGRDVPQEDVARVCAAFARRPVARASAGAKEPLAAILDQAALGYGVIAVGATDARVEGRLASHLVDELLAASPLPVVMVRRGVTDDPFAAPRYRRILVPATGTLPGRAAQEMAFGLAAALGASCVIAHVVTTPTPSEQLALPRWSDATAPLEDAPRERSDVAERVVAEARSLAAEMGVHAEAAIRAGLSAPDALLELARAAGVDLLVLAANLRQFSGRPFLGHGVEYLLEKSECAVVVVTAPPGFAR
jgi:Kef-type K+ transport system membrane component KefB